MSVSEDHDYSPGLLPLMEETSEKKLSTLFSSSDTVSLNLKETELRLGLPGRLSPGRESHANSASKGFFSGAKRGFTDVIVGTSIADSGKERKGLLHLKKEHEHGGYVVSHSKDKPPEKSTLACGAPAAKAQVVGWPPIRSFRKNTMQSSTAKSKEEEEGKGVYDCLYVKVSMEGVPFLRKVDLKIYSNYGELSSALEKMFSSFTKGKCGSSLKDLLCESEYVLTYEDKDGDLMLVGDVPWEMFTSSCKKLRIMRSSEAVGLAPRRMDKRP